MISLLFDIDGTLLRCGGAGMKAVSKALKQMFGVASVSGIRVHGRTDHGIMTDVFRAISQDYQAHRKTFDELYWQLLPGELQVSGGILLPGVLPLLDELAGDPEIALGILTGNAKAAAVSKLMHFGIDHYFEFGGYGDHHSDRDDVAACAVAEARSAIGEGFQERQVWVVGDTVNDIRCARSVGANVIAVETGGGSPSGLAEAGPDAQMVDLSDCGAFVRAIKSSP